VSVETTVARRLAAAHARLRTVGVTGTNGKTTTTSMVAAITEAAGETSARATTVGSWVGDEPMCGDNQAHEFLVTVEHAVARGVRTIAVEMTSWALGEGLVRSWSPHVGVFTNLTRDHLDIHGSPEAYLAAKAQIVIALPPGGAAVLNADDPASALLAEVVPTGVAQLTFAQRDRSAALVADEVDVSPTGTRIAFAPGALADQLDHTVELAVVGEVHAQNAMAAALAAHSLGYSADAIKTGLARFAGVPGRFEVIATSPLVVVDYAHTPDGLSGTLATARSLVRGSGRVVCVFGCGGNRDRGKRPQMGAVADACADVVVLTTDNPRYESPQTIAAEVAAGVSSARARWIIELDRARAIQLAIAGAGTDDIVVLAGKGHELTQEIEGITLPFSDAHVARTVVGATHH
jgi:UDP-N-acetylmuramoyl-L-alanyl-D-glutamate--2,6-diaminopimelate ligase